MAPHTLNLTDLFGDFVLSVPATLGSEDFKVLFPKKKIYFFSRRKTRDPLNPKLRLWLQHSRVLTPVIQQVRKGIVLLARRQGTLLCTVGWEEYVWAPH